MATRAGGYLRAPPPHPAPYTPPSPPAPPRLGRALTLGLRWQIPRRGSRGGQAERPSPSRRGDPGPEVCRGTLPPFSRPPGAPESGREGARRWITGSFSLPRATGLGGQSTGAPIRGRRAGGAAAPGPSRGAGGPGVRFLRSPTCRRTPRAARAGASSFAERAEAVPGAQVPLGASGLLRREDHPPGQEPPLTNSSASPGVP